MSSILTRCLVLLTVVSACGGGDETGNATINYKLGTGVACDAQLLGIGGLGVVETVRATLMRGDTMIVRDEPCNPDEGISVDTAPAGNYDLLVEGLDAVGTPVMNNVKHAPSQQIEIIGGSSQDFDADLFPAPAIVEAKLDVLVDGQFAQCQFLEVQFIELTMFRNATPMLTFEFDVCQTMPGYNPVPDLEGLIEGAELNQINVVAKDPSQNEVADFTIPLDPPGAGKTVQVSITCDNTDCEGQLDSTTGGGGDDGGDTGAGDTGGGTTSGGTGGTADGGTADGTTGG
jgi:hypothetical protein